MEKPTLVRMFCEKNNLQLVEFNFEQNRTMESLFAVNDPTKIIQSVEFIRNVKIDAKNSVLFLDEIQANLAAIFSQTKGHWQNNSLASTFSSVS